LCNQIGAAAFGDDSAAAAVPPGSENDGYGIPVEDWNAL
jgi:hypothetical protein